MNARTYIALETKFIDRLQRDWARRSGPIYRNIVTAVKEKNYAKARGLVSELDMTETGTENREWIKYLLLAFATLGARSVIRKGETAAETFVGVGTFDKLLNQVTTNIQTYLEHTATAQVQEQALQLIAEDEQKSLATKADHKYGSTQIELSPTSSAAAYINMARERIADQHLLGNGKDVTPNHVTVRYGLLDDDADRLREFIQEQSPFEATITGLEKFNPSESSDWAVPLVARVESPVLRSIEHEIEHYGHFKANTWPDYKPHVTLAYIHPEVVDHYQDLDVSGTFYVQGLTIVYASGVKETVPFESRMHTVTKADKSGRYVTEHVSFANQGEDKLQLIASLNASRLATWGFTAEAEYRGITRYRLDNVMDGRTSEFCWMIHGKTFEVTDARSKVIEVLNVQDPDDLKTVQPWPSQSDAAIKAYDAMTSEELTARGLHIPPFHPRCRTVCKVIVKDGKVVGETGPKPIAPQAITVETLKELGLPALQEHADKWNAFVGSSPVQILSKLTGMTTDEVLTTNLGLRPVTFGTDGTIGIKAKGIMDNVKYSMGTVLDPYTMTYYLTEAEFVTGSASAEAGFLKHLFQNVVQVGEDMGAAKIVADVAGNAANYVKMGFLPDPEDWTTIKDIAVDELENGDLKGIAAQLQPEQKMLVDHLLMDLDEQALNVLVNLDITIEGKSIGEWILRNTTGQFALDLTNKLAAEQAKAYFS